MIPNPNNNETAVLSVIPSPRKKYVNAVNINIPDTNDTNLPGQRS